jgi:phage terminase large subunit-like protein
MNMIETRKLKSYKPSRFKSGNSVYKEKFADIAVHFINQLKHTKGKWYGEPFVLLDWQEQIIRDVFGIVNRKTECRQFRRVYVEVPKKQGKSELAAAVALVLLCMDLEQVGEIYGCANDVQQARIVFDVARDMVLQFPELSKHIDINKSQKRLTFKPLKSFYQVLSAEAKTKDGFNAHGIIFDELHAQTNRDLFDVMTKGSGLAREQPLQFIITTAGTDRNSICWEQHQYALDVIRGKKIDDTFYPVIFSASDEDDWTSEETWRKCNPSLGVTVTVQALRQECKNAQENPADENTFRRLNLCQWTRQSTRWLPMERWDICNFPVNSAELKGKICYGGLDLSYSGDITAFVLVFPPEDENDKYKILPFFWIPSEGLANRVRKDHVPYDIWQAKGLLETTEGAVINYNFVQQKIVDLNKIYSIAEAAYDPWGAFQISQNLADEGITVVEFRQGYKSLSPPSKELYRLIHEKKIAHGGNLPLRWMFDNVVVSTDAAGNIKPDKQKATEKIDGAVAAIMALDRATRHEKHGSVYDSRGLLAYGSEGWI